LGNVRGVLGRVLGIGKGKGSRYDSLLSGEGESQVRNPRLLGGENYKTVGMAQWKKLARTREKSCLHQGKEKHHGRSAGTNTNDVKGPNERTWRDRRR